MPGIIDAFIARSFAEEDEARLAPLLEYLNTFEKLGFVCSSAKPAEPMEISEKIQKLIRESPVFIGIFTRKYPIPSGDSAEPQRWTAPSWVLQESGYALGLGKKLVFFVEPGVELPQLQGDLEYVSYDANKPQEAFKRTNEIVHTIVATNLAIEVRPTLRQEAQAPPEEKAVTEEERKPEVPEVVNQLLRIADALRMGDTHEAQNAYQAGIEEIRKQDPDGELMWTALYHQRRALFGLAEGLDDLRTLQEEHPESREVANILGHCLNKLGEFESAADMFEKAADKTTDQRRAHDLISAANCWDAAKQHSKAEVLFMSALSLANPKDRLEVLSKIYDHLKNTDSEYESFAVGEYSLRGNGAQSDLRFKMAYDYAESDLKNLAVEHYTTLLDQRTDNAATNNLALLLGPLGLPRRAVELFKEAVQQGNALAAGNLAFRYLNAGLSEEAKSIVDRALQSKTDEPMVTDALAAIGRQKEEEAEKYKEICQGATKQRAFLAAMGEALLKRETVAISGVWMFPEASIRLTTEGNQLKGSGEEPIYPDGLAALFLDPIDRGKPWKRRICLLEGKLTGRVAKFTMTIETKFAAGEGLTGDPHERREGYLVFGQKGVKACALETEPEIKLYNPLLEPTPDGGLDR